MRAHKDGILNITSKNSAKLKQYYCFYAEFLEEILWYVPFILLCMTSYIVWGLLQNNEWNNRFNYRAPGDRLDENLLICTSRIPKRTVSATYMYTFISNYMYHNNYS
jgi:hypothetical protein